MIYILCTGILLILLLSLVWLNPNKAGAVKAYILIILLAASLFVSLSAPSLDSPFSDLLSFMVVLIGGFGGSVPAAYFVGRLKEEDLSEEPKESGIRGQLGFLKFSAELQKPPAPLGADGGGKLIGICERIALVLAVLTSQVSVLAVVIAVKGLARYPEIKSGHLASEKFIVGTFVSLLWAAGCALLAVNMR